MKYFLDTEFIEAGPSNPLVLLSVGIVAEDGREFYAVNDQANLINMSDWVRDNVMPHLGNFTMSFDAIRRGVKNFVNDTPEFWGYYADYDWVIFCQIFGSMIDLPKGWPMYCRDIKQLCDAAGNPKLPAQISTEHNALHDAKWNKIAYEFLVERAIAESQAWISVEKETPPIGSRVWSATKSGRVLVAWRTGWAGVNDWTMEGLATLDEGDSVTHWMPVPEPPKGNENV